ncbi:transcriptional regulator [Calothrix sp. NIES-2100]|uniref:helix-turn-helix domain-containing protein n=1 Tax=Calothrix sp. NIES-2100 TaxID=1954172 RepID=UPI000B604724|nr:transcriptional regulator [Calothrix sp. NIES-2100]
MKVERKLLVETPDLPILIKQARLASNRTVKDLAASAGMTQDNWFKIESATIKSLPEPTLRRIEGVLNTDFGVDF